MNVPRGEPRHDATLLPVSGMALPLYQGEVLRVTQVTGKQCVDFNCFNLSDYRERMSVGHMRRKGFRAKEGDVVISNRNQPLLAIVHMSDTCVSDMLGARCFAVGGEAEYGLLDRTNCQDTLAESIREFGLTPDDVHDSLNLWMHTIWTEITAAWRPIAALGPPGDFVDFLALTDVLAVPVICGSGDLGQVSNFALKPIRVQIFPPSVDSSELADGYRAEFQALETERGGETSPAAAIRTERELRLVPDYRPPFRESAGVERVSVDLGGADLARLRRLNLAQTDERSARVAFVLWYQANRGKTRLLP